MTLSLTKIVAVLAAAMLTASCGGGVAPIGLAPNIELVDLTSLPAPETGREGVIGPQEQIDITVVNSAILSGTFFTDAQGYLSYPLLGDLYLAGKSSSQASKMIADRLRGDLIIDPQVTVRIAAPKEASISVGGQVTRPGTYSAATSTSLLRTVNNAGGLSEFAKSDDVLVMRTVGDQRYIGVFNIEAIQRGNYPDPALYPNDIVTVGESASRRRLDTILQLVPLASTAAILLERGLN